MDDRLLHFFKCRSDCGDPGLIGNGQRELTGTAVGEIVTFSCFEGFRMEGSQLRECGQGGLWSGSVPVCTCELEGWGEGWNRGEQGG